MKNCLDKYRKKLARTREVKSTPSPATKVKKMTCMGRVTPEIRKRLLFDEVVISALETKNRVHFRNYNNYFHNRSNT